MIVYLIDYISIKFNINNDNGLNSIFTMGDMTDDEMTGGGLHNKTQNMAIKSMINLLLPYISDANNRELYNKLTDLEHILTSKPLNTEELKNTSRDEIIKTYFEYSNMGIGLLTDGKIPTTMKIMIEHNFISLLRTISIMNGSMYVNGIDIFPISPISYKESIIFTETHKILNEKKNVDGSVDVDGIINSEFDINYKGLWVGTIYNILVNKFYYQVKPVKWLIFVYENNNDDNDIKYLIEFLHRHIIDSNDMKTIMKTKYIDKDYKKLSNDELKICKLIHQTLNNIIEKFKQFIEKTEKTLTPQMKEVMLYFFLYLYNYDNNEIKKYIIDENNTFDKKFKIKNENDKEDYILHYKKDTNNNDDEIIIKNFIKELIKFDNSDFNKIKNKNTKAKNTQKILWKFLHDKLNEFKECPFGYYFFNAKSEYIYIKGNQYDECNFKNIFNICKIISHNQEWEVNDKNYISLSDDAKKQFLYQLYPENGEIIILSKQFNQNYARQKMIENSDRDKQSYKMQSEYVTNMIQRFSDIYLDYVFIELARTGLLSEFRTNLEPDKWRECHDYISNNPYNDEFINYITDNNTGKWNHAYSLNWVMMLNFFHKYINHQILFITGATGQGKSTQIPKLLLYSMKCIDHKYNGKIICTQPRIVPTINNANRISEELCHSIKDGNQYIQYKYNGSDTELPLHINPPHNILQICTDGILYTSLIDNITMKNKMKTGDYINENQYDIIIIDEAHEHNKNMDIILSLCKQTCYMNNTIRLVIVSATMQDDEPIYRQYYKSINENLLYPIKTLIKKKPIMNIKYDITFSEDLFEDIGLLPLAEYIDKRIDISPPGKTTRYNITDIYLETDIDVIEDGKIDYDKSAKRAHEYACKCAIDICSNTTNGHILLFSTGTSDIIKAVELLNNNLPNDIIALPYYGELDDKYRDIISNIEKYLPTIKNDKNKIIEEWKNDISNPNIPDNTYKRAIIVATNVAEASITIEGLSFVIDNGYAKINKFSSKMNKDKLVIDQISESSRIQRRGRVGRRGDGVVYYMYMKGAREKNKTNYKIAQENISSLLIDLASSKEAEFLYLTKNERDEETNQTKLILTDYDPHLFNDTQYGIKEIIRMNNKILLFDSLFNYQGYTTKYINILANNYYIKYFDRLRLKNNYEINDSEMSLIKAFINGDMNILNKTSTQLKNNIRALLKNSYKHLEHDKTYDKIFNNIYDRIRNIPELLENKQYHYYLANAINKKYNKYNENINYRYDLNNTYAGLFFNDDNNIRSGIIENYDTNIDDIHFRIISKYYTNYNNNSLVDTYPLTAKGIPFIKALDLEGLLFMIHPFENLIKRNIYNEIIEFNNQVTNKIDYNAYYSVFTSLISSNSILDISREFKVNDMKTINNSFFVKTELATFISALITKLTSILYFKANDILTLFIAKALGCLEEVYSIIIFINNIRNNMENIKPSNMKYTEFYKIYNCGMNHSDILLIHDIITNFNNNFSLSINEINKISNKKTKKYKSIIKELYDNLDNDIDKWCESNYLNNISIKKFKNKIINVKSNIEQINKIFNENDNNIKCPELTLEDRLHYIKNIISKAINVDYNDDTLKDRIMLSFIIGNSSLFGFKQSTTDNIFKIPINCNLIDGKYKTIENGFNTFTNTNYTCVLFLDYDFDSDVLEEDINISLISRIDSKMLLFAGNFNSQSIIQNINNTEYLYGDAYDRFKQSIIENYQSYSSIIKSNIFPIINFYYNDKLPELFLYIKLINNKGINDILDIIESKEIVLCNEYENYNKKFKQIIVKSDYSDLKNMLDKIAIINNKNNKINNTITRCLILDIVKDRLCKMYENNSNCKKINDTITAPALPPPPPKPEPISWADYSDDDDDDDNTVINTKIKIDNTWNSKDEKCILQNNNDKYYNKDILHFNKTHFKINDNFNDTYFESADDTNIDITKTYNLKYQNTKITETTINKIFSIISPSSAIQVGGMSYLLLPYILDVYIIMILVCLCNAPALINDKNKENIKKIVSLFFDKEKHYINTDEWEEKIEEYEIMEIYDRIVTYAQKTTNYKNDNCDEYFKIMKSIRYIILLYYIKQPSNIGSNVKDNLTNFLIFSGCKIFNKSKEMNSILDNIKTNEETIKILSDELLTSKITKSEQMLQKVTDYLNNPKPLYGGETAIPQHVILPVDPQPTYKISLPNTDTINISQIINKLSEDFVINYNIETDLQIIITLCKKIILEQNISSVDFASNMVSKIPSHDINEILDYMQKIKNIKFDIISNEKILIINELIYDDDDSLLFKIIDKEIVDEKYDEYKSLYDKCELEIDNYNKQMNKLNDDIIELNKKIKYIYILLLCGQYIDNINKCNDKMMYYKQTFDKIYKNPLNNISSITSIINKGNAAYPIKYVFYILFYALNNCQLINQMAEGHIIFTLLKHIYEKEQYEKEQNIELASVIIILNQILIYHKIDSYKIILKKPNTIKTSTISEHGNTKCSEYEDCEEYNKIIDSIKTLIQEIKIDDLTHLNKDELFIAFLANNNENKYLKYRDKYLKLKDKLKQFI